MFNSGCRVAAVHIQSWLVGHPLSHRVRPQSDPPRRSVCASQRSQPFPKPRGGRDVRARRQRAHSGAGATIPLRRINLGYPRAQILRLCRAHTMPSTRPIALMKTKCHQRGRLPNWGAVGAVARPSASLVRAALPTRAKQLASVWLPTSNPFPHLAAGSSNELPTTVFRSALSLGPCFQAPIDG